MDEGSVGPHQQGRLTHAVEHRLHRFHPPVSRGEPTPDRQHATKGGGEAVEALDGLRIEGPLISHPMDGDYSRTPAVLDPDDQASKHVAAHRAEEAVINEDSRICCTGTALNGREHGGCTA